MSEFQQASDHTDDDDMREFQQVIDQMASMDRSSRLLGAGKTATKSLQGKQERTNLSMPRHGSEANDCRNRELDRRRDEAARLRELARVQAEKDEAARCEVDRRQQEDESRRQRVEQAK